MDINEIIYKKIIGTITVEEQQLLDEWIEADVSHRQRYESIINNEYFLAQYATYSEIDDDKAWKKLMKRHQPVGSYHIGRRLLQTAAISLIAVSIWFVSTKKTHNPISPVMSQEVTAAIERSEEAGKMGADISIVGTSERIRVSSDSALMTLFSDKDAECELKTSDASEFWVTLEDGTRVHLNYDTRLVYPTKFTDEDRSVFLDGDAFFFVAKDSSRPFLVKTKQGTVKQYGTQFNVNTENGKTEVVLVQGSVGVITANGEYKLRPRQKFTIGGAGNVSIDNADVTPFVAWNEGRFVFEDCRLDKFLSVVSKWYGYKIDFEDESLRTITFTGTFDRYGDISDIIGSIQVLTGLNIDVHSDVITVKK